jgi:antitoxin HigA-1
MIPKNRQPNHPGEILDEEFLKPLGMTQGKLAEKMGVTVQTVNLLVNGRRSVTADTAVALSEVFDTTPNFDEPPDRS